MATSAEQTETLTEVKIRGLNFLKNLILCFFGLKKTLVTYLLHGINIRGMNAPFPYLNYIYLLNILINIV